MSLMRWACLGAAALVAACGLEPTGYSAPYPPPQPFTVDVPARAASLSQQFRRGDGGGDHLGTDFISPIGTPVIAAAPGRVTRSFLDPAYGNTVVIAHGSDIDGQPISTRYVHLASRTVETGARVARGQSIGTMGRSGVLAGGLVHLHFEVWIGDRRDQDNAIDPNTLWVNGTGRVTCFDRGRVITEQPFRITHPVVCQ